MGWSWWVSLRLRFGDRDAAYSAFFGPSLQDDLRVLLFKAALFIQNKHEVLRHKAAR